MVMHLAYIRVLNWQKMCNQCQNGPFSEFLVCCKAYVHSKRTVAEPMSQIGHIGDATSLPAQVVQKWPKHLQTCE